jgi:hypothetical protein
MDVYGEPTKNPEKKPKSPVPTKEGTKPKKSIKPRNRLTEKEIERFFNGGDDEHRLIDFHKIFIFVAFLVVGVVLGVIIFNVFLSSPHAEIVPATPVPTPVVTMVQPILDSNTTYTVFQAVTVPIGILAGLPLYILIPLTLMMILYVNGRQSSGRTLFLFILIAITVYWVLTH